MDAICDGKDVFVPGIMELVERTGVHSGDSISVYPTFQSSQQGQGHHRWTTPNAWDWASASWACINIQFIVDEQERCLCHRGEPPLLPHRPVPLQVHRAAHWSDIATKVMLGQSLAGPGHHRASVRRKRKAGMSRLRPSPSAKLRGMDAYLSPEMKSTGEAIGYDRS